MHSPISQVTQFLIESVLCIIVSTHRHYHRQHLSFFSEAFMETLTISSFPYYKFPADLKPKIYTQVTTLHSSFFALVVFVPMEIVVFVPVDIVVFPSGALVICFTVVLISPPSHIMIIMSGVCLLWNLFYCELPSFLFT